MPASLPALTDDDWEYEYDANSTEDFFFTLDLTSRCAPRKRNDLKGHADLRQSFQAANEGSQQQQQQQQQPAADDEDDEDNGDDNGDADDPDDESRIQILGLHDKNPIISYGGQIYTCEWASALGTDLFFKRRDDPNSIDNTNTDPNINGPNNDDDAEDDDNNPTDPNNIANDEEDDDNPPLTPLHTLPTHDLIGATSARLIAQTANLIPRSSNPTSRPPRPHDPVPGRRPYIHQNDGSRFVVRADAPEAEQQQAAFLNRLQAVKRRLGETDRVRDRSYNNRSLRWRGGPYGGGGGAGDDEDEDDSEDSEGDDGEEDAEQVVDTPPPKRRSTRQQPAKATRPYKRRKPRRGKYEILEERNGSAGPSREAATPETWDQLDGANDGGGQGNVAGDVEMEME
ncbi:hypothetical protein K490DRAFT_56038 [Saccharata proteae CBS 121410]|uniref:Transcription factor TFIIIC triple barrel domain-containing protein n=1 Tax=Saccharata proteae CBS 121410 TaxID=1314787 RepID=A0A9P4HV63_9PEZI|nr:hypothetical protein K490DRAFT_56038 [Saccharata proteae CBS 121410]